MTTCCLDCDNYSCEIVRNCRDFSIPDNCIEKGGNWKCIGDCEYFKPKSYTPPLPEHEKYNHDFALLIEEFLDFLGSKNIQLCSPDEKIDCFFPTRQTRMELIFEFLGVDLRAWEKENQALLDYMRRLNELDKLNETDKK